MKEAGTQSDFFVSMQNVKQAVLTATHKSDSLSTGWHPYGK